MPAGNPAPPRPRKLDFLTSSIRALESKRLNISRAAAYPPSFSYSSIQNVLPCTKNRESSFSILFYRCQGGTAFWGAARLDHFRRFFLGEVPDKFFIIKLKHGRDFTGAQTFHGFKSELAVRRHLAGLKAVFFFKIFYNFISAREHARQRAADIKTGFGF